MTLASRLTSSPRLLSLATAVALALATAVVLTPITAWAQDDARELPPTARCWSRGATRPISWGRP